MNVLRRAARVVADEGVVELFRRAGRKVMGRSPITPISIAPSHENPPTPPDDPLPALIAQAKRQYDQQVAAFREATRGRGVDGLEQYYWYHTIDLGGGLVTPGDYDFRGQWAATGMPDDLSGMRVLDVGSATGHFAFEFARRGAEVTSVELPTLADWDLLSHERDGVIAGLMVWLQATTPEVAYVRHLDGPFRFCQERLGFAVRRCYSSVYDLTLAKVGGERFDLVYAGDVLLHLFSPLKALDVLAGLCRGQLIATVEASPHWPLGDPLMRFMGLAIKETDRRTWWMLNQECVCDMLKRLGFRSAAVVGGYSGIARRAWFPYTREVIRATR